MRKANMVCVGVLFLSGCYSMTEVQPPKLDAYEKALRRGESGDLLKLAAQRDAQDAAEWCWTRSNNYEKRSKNSEYWKLGLGSSGGVFGFTGAMLVAAGTGGFAAGIASGLAGVVSTTLGNAEKGPLGVSEFVQERDGIATGIRTYMSGMSAQSDPLVLHTNAIQLVGTCRSAPSPTAAVPSTSPSVASGPASTSNTAPAAPAAPVPAAPPPAAPGSSKPAVVKP
ncbi:UNVERIFIED_ORG: hypothetical protein J2Y84_001954 [Pseudomonas reinekei]|nr:hypothetical protein [Pseudomonas reinekei]